jgi:DNA-binding SARP family transcriptional activator
MSAVSGSGRGTVVDVRRSDCVRFDVLGPLRAMRGVDDVALGAVQQRVVLAVLLLHANRPIARQQLLDAVWGQDAPTYAVNLLQKHVSGLRRVFGREEDWNSG